jgi:hypothetical protein
MRLPTMAIGSTSLRSRAPSCSSPSTSVVVRGLLRDYEPRGRNALREPLNSTRVCGAERAANGVNDATQSIKAIQQWKARCAQKCANVDLHALALDCIRLQWRSCADAVSS